MIENIREGMTMGEFVTIINKLIDQYNSIEGVIGEAVVNGKIDYNAVSNRPSIEEVELVGKLNLDSLGAAGQSTVESEIKEVVLRVNAAEETISGLPTSETVSTIRDKVNEIITRTNRLASSACGEDPIEQCLQPVQQLE